MMPPVPKLPLLIVVQSSISVPSHLLADILMVLCTRNFQQIIKKCKQLLKNCRYYCLHTLQAPCLPIQSEGQGIGGVCPLFLLGLYTLLYTRELLMVLEVTTCQKHVTKITSVGFSPVLYFYAFLI